VPQTSQLKTSACASRWTSSADRRLCRWIKSATAAAGGPRQIGQSTTEHRGDPPVIQGLQIARRVQYRLQAFGTDELSRAGNVLADVPQEREHSVVGDADSTSVASRSTTA